MEKWQSTYGSGDHALASSSAPELGRADVFADNIHVAHRLAAELPGATVLDGRSNVVQMSIAVPKSNAAALPVVNDFVREAKRDGLIAEAIARGYVDGIKAYFAKFPVS